MLELNNINKSYGDLQVLKNVSFSVKKGEVIAIIGPSGSGKSTLIKTINCLVHPDQGTMMFDQKQFDFTTIKKREITELRKTIGMVFQNFGLFHHLTILDNLMIVLQKVRKLSREEGERLAFELLDLVGLEEKAQSYPIQLSGGQQQRVGIARALASNPKLILMDEPTSALDPELVGEVLQTIKGLASRGNTMILVTHEMAFAREVADRVVFLDQGQVVMDDRAEVVFSDETHPRIQQFLKRFLAG